MFSARHRALPGTVLETGSVAYLFDCGDGALSRLKAMGIGSIDLVAVTSIGTSETSGLLALGEAQRTSAGAPLAVVGPPGLRDALAALSCVSTLPADELFSVTELQPGCSFPGTVAGHHLEAVEVECESNSTIAYRLFEDSRPGRVDASKASRLGIKGPEIGLLQAGERVRNVRPEDVVGPRRRGRRFVFAGRGRPTEDLEAALLDAECAVFAAPFMDDRFELAEESSFMTGWEASALCERHGVSTVVLLQLGPYAPARFFVAEARQFHAQTFAPNDGEQLVIPVPDSGPPSFVKRR